MSAPAISPISPVGSTRIQHTYLDWTQLTAAQYSNLGPGQTPCWAQDKINLSSSPPARGGAWQNMSGINKQNGLLMMFEQASSFNIGSFGEACIPCVGRNPAAKSPTYIPSETQQYWAWNFQLAQGSGVPQSGFPGIQPPYSGIDVDVGVFFFVQDFNKSASSYLQFSDNGGSNGAEYGFGFFLDVNGEWHYGVRYSKLGVPTPLDIDVILPPGSGLHQWPVPVTLGVPDYSQFVNLTLEFIAPGVVGENAPSEFRASINGRPLINTTFADIGVAPVGAGLSAQIPDFYSYDSLSYGIVGCVRAGPGTGSPTQTFPLCFNEIEYIAGPFASTTVASP